MRFQEFMQKSLLMEVHQKYHKFFTPLVKELRKEGLNLNEALILLALFFETQPNSTPSQLSSSLSLGKDQISHALKSLTEKSLVSTTTSSHDRRKRTLRLNNKSKEICSRLVKLFNQYENQIEEN